ncbi:Multidrug efflux pump subunit AcrA (membrane-fusion protein) [Pelagirhabdus alkalitolerans]|uniref:Multidrug efflux pump subunit AcrA (Membrane-fusion protein) n=1 Tax=Pelagirhabdus alkalitolerans TaxID=1612202 RepID=A0A1G6GFW2_9BACI|nr:HlyD family efflux transporter periplasmic adaptor subunit [Pelagirhabdus alkalitolerans]SDB80877.1 Multidrug efflux pump subunit AcrA (membrane-fusion protein) [Pelagirhabdus alkalitolerans]
MKKVVSLLIVMMMVLIACNDDNGSEEQVEEDQTVAVEAEQVEEGDLTINQSFYGRTEPVSVTPVMAPAVGEVDEVHVSVGDSVEEDDVLITMISMENGMEVELTADEDGRIADLELEEGDITSTEEPAMLIVDLAELDMTVEVTALRSELFEVDDEFDVTISDDDEVQTATVENVSVLPGETGMYEVSLSIDNEADWKVGVVARIDVAEETLTDALLIPTQALNEDDEGYFVYRIEDDVAERVDVEAELIQSDYTAIDGDVEVDEWVVTSGQLTLDDGDSVEFQEEDVES